jgi:hypothetical protein
MFRIKPNIDQQFSCKCGNDNLKFDSLVWQGVFIGAAFFCKDCNSNIIFSLPNNQGAIDKFKLHINEQKIFNENNEEIKFNWSNEKFHTILKPIYSVVPFEVEIRKKFNKVIILNTLDFIYGHSLLFLLNLQRIIELNPGIGIVLVVQPMMKWLIPTEGISEVWTVKLGFGKLYHYYPDLSDKINDELNRFDEIYLSEGHIIPTNKNIEIEKFTGVKPYNFFSPPVSPRVTFIWREDPGRVMVRSIYLVKIFQKLGFKRILLPLQYLKIRFLFFLLKNKLPSNYQFTITGLGNFGKMPSFIQDLRVLNFNDDTERELCKLYSESALVFGVHGSSMLLPSAHAGMTLSLMPSKRWGNYQEDVLFVENDPRLALFQKRIIPLNLSIFEIKDIIVDMICSRSYFVKKFVHSEEL